jgi:hypothetical protein
LPQKGPVNDVCLSITLILMATDKVMPGGEDCGNVAGTRREAERKTRPKA